MDTKPGERTTDEAEARGADVDGAPPASASVPAMSSSVVDDVPDPDEDDLDDLDDLDDMLDDFSTVKLDATRSLKTAEPITAPGAAGPQAKATAEAQHRPHEEPSEDEFAKQLQAGMADLLGELEDSPEMQEQFEDMFKQISAAAEPVPAKATGTSSAAEPPRDAGADASFQDTIRRTMERMQTSGDQATAAAASGGADDFMSEMLKQLSSGDFNPEGGDEDLSKMLMGMMEQLTNKDILYEPMKELDDKFPAWLDKNKDSTPPGDLERYQTQRVLVRDIVARFEESSFADTNVADREYIVDRMQKMQAAGSPPADLVGDMASAQEALGATDDECNPQ